MPTNIKLGLKNAIKQVGINWDGETLNEALNVFGNIEMNNFLVQGYVDCITTGPLGARKSGGIFLFNDSGSEIVDRPGTRAGILEVIPSTTHVIQRVTAIGDSGVTGATYIRSGRTVNELWQWSNWITVSNSGSALEVEDTVTEHSTNPVTSAGIYTAIQNATTQTTDPYMELYVDSMNLGANLFLRLVNFQNTYTTYSTLINSTDFKKALLNNITIYTNSYGSATTSDILTTGVMFYDSGLATNTWTLCFPKSYVVNGAPFDGAQGTISYNSNDGLWYFTTTSFYIAPWYQYIEDTNSSFAGTAARATADSSGNDIETTYATKIENKNSAIYYVEGSGSSAAVTTTPYYASVWKGTNSDITSLYTGLTINYKNDIAGSSSYGVLLNINNLGEHPVVRNVATNISTTYAVGSIIPLVYDAEASATVAYQNSNAKVTIQGVWKHANYTDGNTTNIYKIYPYATIKNTTVLYQYKFCVSNINGDVIPLNSVSSKPTTTYTKALTSEYFDPFGQYYYYASTTTQPAGTNLPNLLYINYLVEARYSFNINKDGTAGTTALTAGEPVYLKAIYNAQGNGLAQLYQIIGSANYLERSSITQSLPSVDPNGSLTSGEYIYIYIGHAYDTYRFGLTSNHPVYAWRNGQIQHIDAAASEIQAPTTIVATAAGTAAKVGGGMYYALNPGNYLQCVLKNSNTYAGAITLNVNSTGAKPIYINGAASSSTNYTLPAGTYFIYYDGNYYHFRTDGVLPGKVVLADRAIADENGNNIASTYLKIADEAQADWQETNTSSASYILNKPGLTIESDGGNGYQLVLSNWEE